MTQKAYKETIQKAIDTSDAAVYRALILILKNQEKDEVAYHQTRHNNGVGFNQCDAEILTSFALQILRWHNMPVKQYDKPLSPKQTALARKKVRKYWKQLIEHVETKAQREQTKQLLAA